MLEVLQFVFSSFWTFCGTLFLIVAIGIVLPIPRLNLSLNISKKMGGKIEQNTKSSGLRR